MEDAMSAYERFADVYDKMGSDRFSARMFGYTEQLLGRLGYRPKSVLDLACGTGTAALKWAARNLVTFGIDGSPHMLTVARRKAR
jgi:ubiquinone/menaquinone biosynthesis C-methylase UbiE